jgi:tripartite-type tricarboxylate transporter receptor subunit TctC
MRLIAVVLLLFGYCTASFAQGYPSRPIRMICPFQAGSAPDIVARVVAQRMQEVLGQTVIVENRVGAGATIGTAEVAKAKPDGYTILLASNSTHAANASLFKNLPYDQVRDFAGIAQLTTVSLLLVVRNDFPADNLREFLAYAKAHPGKLSGGHGTAAPQIAVAMLRVLGGLDVLAIPYKGGGPQAVMDIQGGQLSFTYADIAFGMAQVRAGKLKGLAVTSAKRASQLPEIPTMSEALPGFDVAAWHGLVAPAGTPPDIVAKLADAAAKTMASPEVLGRLSAIAVEPTPTGAAEFSRFIQTETQRWGVMLKQAGVEPQ